MFWDKLKISRKSELYNTIRKPMRVDLKASSKELGGRKLTETRKKKMKVVIILPMNLKILSDKKHVHKGIEEKRKSNETQTETRNIDVVS